MYHLRLGMMGTKPESFIVNARFSTVAMDWAVALAISLSVAVTTQTTSFVERNRTWI